MVTETDITSLVAVMNRQHDSLLQVSRITAWEKAKANLQCMMSTFQVSIDSQMEPDSFDDMSAIIDKFVVDLEECGLRKDCLY